MVTRSSPGRRRGRPDDVRPEPSSDASFDRDDDEEEGERNDDDATGGDFDAEQGDDDADARQRQGREGEDDEGNRDVYAGGDDEDDDDDDDGHVATDAATTTSAERTTKSREGGAGNETPSSVASHDEGEALQEGSSERLDDDDGRDEPGDEKNDERGGGDVDDCDVDRDEGDAMAERKRRAREFALRPSPSAAAAADDDDAAGGASSSSRGAAVLLRHCSGPCRLPKPRGRFSASQWAKRRGAARFCLECMAADPDLHERKLPSLDGGGGGVGKRKGPSRKNVKKRPRMSEGGDALVPPGEATPDAPPTGGGGGGGAAAASPTTTTACTFFRHDEVTTIWEEIDTLASSRKKIAFFQGQPGTGKSTAVWRKVLDDALAAIFSGLLWAEKELLKALFIFKVVSPSSSILAMIWWRNSSPSARKAGVLYH